MKKSIILFCAIICFYNYGISQTTIQLNPSIDNTLFESETGSLSNGAGQYLFVGQTANDESRRAVLKFDIASNIPDSATITAVTLSLNMNKTVAGSTNIDLHTLSSDWGEGTSNASGQEGGGTTAENDDATWIHTFHPSSSWTNPGGDFNETSSASTAVAGNGDYNWSSESMISEVQGWLGSPETNFGWILIGEEATVPSAKRFASRENSTAANQPELSITYTIPCSEPEIPTLESSLSTICSGETATLSVTGGNLNDATNWQWYESECGENNIGTGINIDVAPESTTSYFVRGEGSCASAAECATITIEVNPTYSTSFSVDICDGESYIFEDDTLTESGTYSQTFTAVNSCDSIVELTLTVHAPQNESLNASICEGESYILGTQTILEAGTYTETFSSVYGCDSIVELSLHVNPTYFEMISAIICEGETYMLGTQTLTTSGVYTEVFGTTENCDSTVELTLSIEEIDTSLILTEDNLMSNQDNASYQWIDCNTGMLMEGETNQSFTPVENGIYAVIINLNSCIDTSSCFDFVYNSTNSLSSIKYFSIYPNPVKEILKIELNNVRDKITVQIIRIDGKLIFEESFYQDKLINVNVEKLNAGLYFCKISSGMEIKNLKFVKAE